MNIFASEAPESTFALRLWRYPWLKGVPECLDGQENSVGRTMDPWVDLVPKSKVDDGLM